MKMKYRIITVRYSEGLPTTFKFNSEAEMNNRLQFEVNKMKDKLPIGETAEIWVTCYKRKNPYVKRSCEWMLLAHYYYFANGHMKKEKFSV